MFKNYVKCLLMVCLSFIFDVQAEDRATLLYQGQPMYLGMNPLRREALATVEKPSFFKTYTVPMLAGAGGAVFLANKGLQGSEHWNPYVTVGSGILAASLLLKTMRDDLVDRNKSQYLQSLASTLGGAGIGFVLAKILKDRWNPYMFAAAASAGALCGVGMQSLFTPRQNIVEQSVGHPNIPLSVLLNPRIEQIIQSMDIDPEASKYQDNPQQIDTLRRYVESNLGDILSDDQKRLLSRAYNVDQMKGILQKNVSDSNVNELNPKSFKLWLQWAEDYRKTVQESRWLSIIKDELQLGHYDWVKADNLVYRFMQSDEGPKVLNDILKRDDANLRPEAFFEAIQATQEFNNWQNKSGPNAGQASGSASSSSSAQQTDDSKNIFNEQRALRFLLGDDQYVTLGQKHRSLWSRVPIKEKKEGLRFIISPLSDRNDAKRNPLNQPLYLQLTDQIDGVTTDNEARDIVYQVYRTKGMEKQKKQLLNTLFAGIKTNLNRLSDIESGKYVSFTKKDVLSAIRLLFTRIYELEKPHNYMYLIKQLESITDVSNLEGLYKVLEPQLDTLDKLLQEKNDAL